MAHAHDEPVRDDHAPEVIAESTRNPGVRSVRVRRNPPADASFIKATLQGLGVTIKHFFRNVVTRTDTETIQYPEEKIPYPPRSRGLHRLMLRDDGAVRCVACMCCPTVCPAHCITIVPGESSDGGIEKFPAVFEIDELKCVVCGLCVEACPCDAIRMDTGVHAMPVEARRNAVMTKDLLMSRGAQSTATQGGIGATWRTTAPDTPRMPHDRNRRDEKTGGE